MYFPTSILALTTLLTLTLAAPAEEKRQAGGFIYATQTYYSGGGCTGTADGEATFASSNLCQPIHSVLGSVVSVSALSVESGCVVHYYTNATCTAGDTIGVIGHCEQASAAFVATNVICPT